VILQSKIQNFDEPLYLESGRVFSNFKLAYETYGELNPDKSNVIVICHALTGSAHAAGLYEGDVKPGWWDGLIGDHKAVDTTKFFVICINILASPFGSTCPLDVDESSGREYRLRFPVVVVSDVVRAQMMLLKRLGIAPDDRLRSPAPGRLRRHRLRPSDLLSQGWELAHRACGDRGYGAAARHVLRGIRAVLTEPADPI